jgi:ABC-type transporter Mla MlaB component
MANTSLCIGGLNVDLEEKPEETIVHCSGQITKDAALRFHTEIRDRVIPLSRGKGVALTCRIVLDLSRVSYVDANGMCAILGVWTDAQRKSCKVEIVNQGPGGGPLRRAWLNQLFCKFKYWFSKAT